ncbi:MAG: hypothetical protein ACMUIM_06160 [bacterium]
MLVFTIWGFMILLPIDKAYGLKGSAEYLWEQKKRKDNKRTSELTQTYELIFSRRLQPLYDASLKFEFRSETRDEGEDKERTQLLPSLNMRLGNELMNLNLGWSEDTITESRTDTITGEEEVTYTNERVFSGLAWRPKQLPNILIQFQEEERDYSGAAGPAPKDTRISINEDYTITLGYLTFDHSFNQDRRDADDRVTTTYDLLNTGSIRNRFSFLNNKLDIRTGFESSQGEDKQEDGDINRTWKNNASFSMIGYPVTWMRPQYQAFWGEDKTSQPDKRDTSIGHNISIFLNPNPYLPSTIGMNYSRTEQGQESGPREVTTYSLRMEPSLQGLIFDPNIPMYPINTSLLVSNSTEESMGGGADPNMGSRQTKTWSFLLTGSTTIYQGVDLDLDMGLSRRRNYKDNSRRLAERLDTHINLNLLPSLKGSIRQELEWTKDHGGTIERNDFEGSLETKLIYRPVETFMLDVGNTQYYDGEDSGYQLNFSWGLTSKVELDGRYQSSTKDREEYFSGELDINMTQTIRLELRYQYPTDDQIMKVQFTIRF